MKIPSGTVIWHPSPMAQAWGETSRFPPLAAFASFYPLCDKDRYSFPLKDMPFRA